MSEISNQYTDKISQAQKYLNLMLNYIIIISYWIKYHITYKNHRKNIKLKWKRNAPCNNWDKKYNKYLSE